MCSAVFARTVRRVSKLLYFSVSFAGIFAFAIPYTLHAQTDITAQVMNNDNIVLTGGAYVINVPLAGSAGTVPISAANAYAYYRLDDYGSGHFAASNAPTIVYRGVISGVGVVTVTNATSTVNPSNIPDGSYHPFTGGAVLFTNPQTFSSGSASPSLIIDGNTMVLFDGGKSPDVGGNFSPSANHSRNITNNGYLYSAVSAGWGSIQATQQGAGVVSFENGSSLTNGNTYTGSVYVMNGTHLQQQAAFTDPATNVVQSNIFSFETQGNNYMVGPNQPTFKSVFSGNYYSWGADTQITGKGIQVFTGLNLPCRQDTKKDHLPAAIARQLDYLTNCPFGSVFYIQASMQMGDGAPIVDNGDGTNNTFLQTNVGAASLIQDGDFEGAPNSQASAFLNQAMGFDYSGTYRYDAGLNASVGKNGLSANRIAPGNLAIINPDQANTGKLPNHLILTSPILIDGITQIDKNAILQLGDGTNGNSYAKTVVLSNYTYSGTYSNSYGNGALITRENSSALRSEITRVSSPIYDEIIDNGQIIVNNVPGALDITEATPGMAAFFTANELDNILGSGSLLQEGTLPLTLMENTTYTGATEIANGTLILATNPAGVFPSLASSSGVDLSGSGGTFDITNAGPQTIQDLSGVSGASVALGANPLTLGTSNSTTFAGTFRGTGNVIKQGSGTLSLTAVSTATGATTVNSGTLRLGDAVKVAAGVSGSLRVLGSSTLSVVGAGFVGGDLSNSGSMKMDGPFATLQVANTATLTGSSQFEVSPSSASTITVQGAATLGGILSIYLDPGSYVAGTYTLLSSSGITGGFSSITIKGTSIAPLTAKVVTSGSTVNLVITSTGSPLPTSPTGLTAVAGANSVTLTWIPSTNATGYNMKRSTADGGPYSTIAANVTGTSFVDAMAVNGTTYFYVVTAINAAGESANSNQATATPISADFSLTSGVTSLVLNSGSSGVVPLSVAFSGGFRAPITFSCSVPLVSVTCAFSSTVLVPAGSNMSTQLTISYPSHTAELNPLYTRARFVTFSGVFLLGFCGLGAGVRKRRRNFSLVGTALVTLFLGNLIGCSGDYVQGHVLSITAVGGGVTHTATVSLLVKN